MQKYQSKVKEPGDTPPRKLLDRVSDRLRVKGYSPRTEEAYREWVKRYVLFFKKRHHGEMGLAEIEEFISYLALEKNLSGSTRNQALNALIFLYREVLQVPIEGKIQAVRSKRPKIIPECVTPEEMRRLLAALQEPYRMMASLLYGSGLRLRECVTLRVRDIFFETGQIIVRSGKGKKDRVTVLSRNLMFPLKSHLQRLKILHEHDLLGEYGAVRLPEDLDKVSPHLRRAWDWQFVFPSRGMTRDPETGQMGRYPMHTNSLQKALKTAARVTGSTKRVTPNTLRHSFASEMLKNGHDVRLVQQLLGHKNVSATMVYTHVLNKDLGLVKSPLDSLNLTGNT
jgi:integron integrase